jgi:putative NADH-flavin reductase
MRLSIFGAETATGRALVEAALEAGHAVTVLAQDPRTVETTNDRLTVVEGDVFDVPTVERVVRQTDAVVTAFDEPLDQLAGTTRVDAMENVVAAANRFRTDRIVAVTGVGGGGNGAGSLRQRLAGALFDRTGDGFEEQERRLVDSGVEWTLVRPVALNDGRATGEYRATAGSDPEQNAPVSRADLAAFVLELFADDAYRGEVVTVGGAPSNGGT